jgi:hypothetical protein
MSWDKPGWEDSAREFHENRGPSRPMTEAERDQWHRENGSLDDRSTGNDMNDRDDFGRDDSNGGGEDAGARDHGPTGVSIDDFLAYMPQRSSYFFTPSRELWPGTSVDARLPPIDGPNGKPIKPSAWLAAHAAVEQTTWAPGEPMLIKDRLVSDGGWIKRPGCHIFNLYRPPALVPQTGEVGPWLDLVHRVFPDQADHIILWLAHRVQRPHEKINHALVLGGKPGIGKDTILEPIKQAVGPWNFADVSPHRILGNFNSHARSVILRISEARDLGDWDRFAFYDRMKGIIAAPPDVVQVNEKSPRILHPQPLRRRDHEQPQDRRNLPTGRRPEALRGVVQLEQHGLRRRLLAQAISVVC